MIDAAARLVSRALATTLRSRWQARLVRAALVVCGVLLGVLMLYWAPPRGLCELLAGMQLLLVVLLCRWPGSMLLAYLPLPLVGWCLAARPGTGAMVALTLLVWLVRRLSALAALAPAHARVDPAVVRLVARDAAVELAMLVAAGALVLAGVALATAVPAGPWWAIGLLAVPVGILAAVDDARRG